MLFPASRSFSLAPTLLKDSNATASPLTRASERPRWNAVVQATTRATRRKSIPSACGCTRTVLGPASALTILQLSLTHEKEETAQDGRDESHARVVKHLAAEETKLHAGTHELLMRRCWNVGIHESMGSSGMCHFLHSSGRPPPLFVWSAVVKFR